MYPALTIKLKSLESNIRKLRKKLGILQTDDLAIAFELRSRRQILDLINQGKTTKAIVAQLRRENITKLDGGALTTEDVTRVRQAAENPSSASTVIDDLEKDITKGREDLQRNPDAYTDAEKNAVFREEDPEMEAFIESLSRMDAEVSIAAKRTAISTIEQQGLRKEMDELASQLKSVKKAYSDKPLGDYRFVGEGVNRYFLPGEADAVTTLRAVSNSRFVRLMDNIRGLTFGLDFSPILGIQMPLCLLF